MKSLHRGVPDLLKNWDEVAERVRKYSRVTIFLDFDGTLVDIAPHPNKVRLKATARRVLERLARHPRATVVVVSGRRRPELLEHIGVFGIHYFGLYGWEKRAKCSLPTKVRAALARANGRFECLLAAYPGLWIENKRSSLSIHLLHVPAALQPRLLREVREYVKPFRKTLHAVRNLRDIEILPRSIPGKGMAVREVLAQRANRSSFPFYFGDDYSDESGFAAVRRGASVHVGKPRPTHARYALRSPAEVASALAKLERTLSAL
jgi:trehalose 6-phosphate phosphatase